MATIKAFLWWIMVVLALSSAGYGQERQLRVNYTDWFPYTFQKSGVPSGFEIDMFDSVMASMNVRVTYESYPWERCLSNLKSGKADVLISMLKTHEREQYTDYPHEHISTSKTVFFKKQGRPVTFDGAYEKLAGYSIGVILGFSYGKAFDQADYLKKDNSIDTRMLVLKLIKGRNDLAAENQAVAIATAVDMGVRDLIQVTGPPIHANPLYVGFSKASHLKRLCDHFSILLHDFKQSDQYPVILARYGISFVDMAAHTQDPRN